MIKLGALWKGTDKDGHPILTGTINSTTRVLILKNGYKREEKHPDYILYLDTNEKKDEKKDTRDDDEGQF